MHAHTQPLSVDRPSRGRMRRHTVIAVTAMTLTLSLTLVTPAAATPPVAARPSVIATWDAIAFRTAGSQGAAAVLDLGLVSAAMYNAVVTIEGRYEPYLEQARAKAHASPEAAAATAAYRVLVAYYPAASEVLAADYATSLAAIPNGVGKQHGVRVGEQAAAAVLASREGDGRNAAIPPLPGG